MKAMYTPNQERQPRSVRLAIPGVTGPAVHAAWCAIESPHRGSSSCSCALPSACGLLIRVTAALRTPPSRSTLWPLRCKIRRCRAKCAVGVRRIICGAGSRDATYGGLQPAAPEIDQEILVLCIWSHEARKRVEAHDSRARKGSPFLKFALGQLPPAVIAAGRQESGGKSRAAAGDPARYAHTHTHMIAEDMGRSQKPLRDLGGCTLIPGVVLRVLRVPLRENGRGTFTCSALHVAEILRRLTHAWRARRQGCRERRRTFPCSPLIRFAVPEMGSPPVGGRDVARLGGTRVVSSGLSTLCSVRPR
ncbi:hypothetical protein B0H21DRAFT_409740 [Amylocystis lapponica]|nr:hypothetical protein B0H21DRAFT_409740 [Amylocystis lapponica]